ncbi:hypothetical protein PR202_gb20235 [Eleusine coracana subsp. coracana]|uniref:Uncharacterized protein n=1 Tax=Eleusine coracana subsp. coracana TaxID=191504 RepID=A0AAV5FAU6_ELECO|nr:hypothetical protein PR202_gb20215 [Eleusine coracana subsp. coracana]GJN31793.1 hypothetical protein PR202_gb20235 [Eleusine coracana subsp. coracana]
MIKHRNYRNSIFSPYLFKDPTPSEVFIIAVKSHLFSLSLPGGLYFPASSCWNAIIGGGVLVLARPFCLLSASSCKDPWSSATPCCLLCFLQSPVLSQWPTIPWTRTATLRSNGMSSPGRPTDTW